MLKEILRIWQDFRPRITYKAKEDKLILACMSKVDEVNKRHYHFLDDRVEIRTKN